MRIYERFPSGYRAIVQALARELRQAEIRIASLSEKDVTARVAEALIYLKKVDPLHLWTRKEIADFCGSTTATVIRVLARLESSGVIRQEGRSILFRNEQALLDLSTQPAFE